MSPCEDCGEFAWEPMGKQGGRPAELEASVWVEVRPLFEAGILSRCYRCEVCGNWGFTGKPIYVQEAGHAC